MHPMNSLLLLLNPLGRSVKTRGKRMEERSPRTVPPATAPHEPRAELAPPCHACAVPNPFDPHLRRPYVPTHSHVPESVHLRRRLWSSCSRAAARTRPPCTPNLLRWQAALSSRTGREGARERLNKPSAHHALIKRRGVDGCSRPHPRVMAATLRAHGKAHELLSSAARRLLHGIAHRSLGFDLPRSPAISSDLSMV